MATNDTEVLDDPFKMIRNNFNFTFICEFLNNFSSAFFNGPDDALPTTPFLEHLLLYQDDAKKIGTFFIKLLKPLPGWRLVSQDNWFESLAKEYKKRDLEVDFPLPATSSTILTIPLLQRLQILRNLCEFHLEQPEHFLELLRVKDGETDWRIEPFGKDSENRRYWVFSDGRMYREQEGIKVTKSSRTRKQPQQNDSLSWDIEDESNWELICLSRSDYDEFFESFTAPINAKDKTLIKIIREEIIPKVEPILNFQLAQHRKYFRPVASERVLLLPRKRSSRLLEKELEEEQRRLAQQEAEKEAEKERQAMRRALLADQIEIVPKTREQIEKDLAAEREQRAEMRRLKKEKEMQIKAIEEAFYSTYEQEKDESNGSESGNESDSEHVNIEIDDPDSSEENSYYTAPTQQPQMTPRSPIKLVLKVSKPMEPLEVNDATEVIEPISAKETKEAIEVMEPIGAIEPIDEIMAVEAIEPKVDESISADTQVDTEDVIDIIDAVNEDEVILNTESVGLDDENSKAFVDIIEYPVDLVDFTFFKNEIDLNNENTSI